ncbi:MAG: putative peptidoglycan binding domain [Candidatus Parcubacteria bacterium]|jgi:peptidoglycan hydrolase-like protein with peptidoglycan-binding domain
MKKYIITSGIALLAFASIVSAQNYPYSRDLTVGMSGPEVTALQAWLISNGYNIPAVSSGAASYGYFGAQTRLAVMAYQRAVGLRSR